MGYRSGFCLKGNLMRPTNLVEATTRLSKQIRSRSDLAINGAKPLFDEPIHVGRPNIGSPDAFLRRASSILERGWLSNNGPVLVEFEQRIAEFLGVKNCVAMCNGTIA